MTDERLLHDLRHLLTAVLGALDEDNPAIARAAAVQVAALLGEAAGSVALREAVLLVRGVVGPSIQLVAVIPNPDLTIPVALLRVLTNLAANARDAMPDDGTLTLTCEQDGDAVTIAIQDTGPGIPADVVERMFEPGFSTKGSTGLGLAIVRETVAEAGGSVAVDSAEAQGTTVTVRWPLPPSWSGLTRPPQAPVARVGRVKPDHDGGRGKTILLTEDEAMLRQLAERALRRAGWHVIATASAETALDAVRTTPPAAVIADLTLPGGMDGRALIASLRDKWPNLPAILVSGYADSGTSADPGGQNVVFLAKPYTLIALTDALRAIVRD